MAKAKARVTVKAGARRQGRLRVVHAGFRGERQDIGLDRNLGFKYKRAVLKESTTKSNV
jgi:hypothetical protein